MATRTRTSAELSNSDPARGQPSDLSRSCDEGMNSPAETGMSVNGTQSRQIYLDSLLPPTRQELKRIASVQQEKEEEISRRRLSEERPDGMSDEERAKAAGLIQRNFRGYKERRQMEGKRLDASSRWSEALKEARYMNAITVRSRESTGIRRSSAEPNGGLDTADNPRARRPVSAMQKWKKVGMIARRAAGDEEPDTDSEDENAPGDSTAEQLQERRKKKEAMTRQRRKTAKMMDLQYWLESVDQYHRYGSNLRTYHQQWLNADTHENFFKWLDEGDGRFVDCAGCPRERLNRERVRYLSREERFNYLVKINKDGLFCWAKNGELIDTTVKYKDSIHGIVADDDATPAYAFPAVEASTGRQDLDSSTSDASHSEQDEPSEQEASIIRGDRSCSPKLNKPRSVKKIRHVSAATIFDKLLRSSVKTNTWIYVADTSFRLYVGIKQSGGFQHSSFLHGSRISSAGTIKVRAGHLDKLSPLSGHYRPTASSFRTFVGSLRDAGVDMSHVSISRSYAVLVGLEAYTRSRRRGKRLVQALLHGRDRLLSPEELRLRPDAHRDRSESVTRERQLSDIQREDDEGHDPHDHHRRHHHGGSTSSLLSKLHLSKHANGGAATKISPSAPNPNPGPDPVSAADLQVHGSRTENGIAPEGRRE
ncbi:MAG: hypothetical protein M1818_001935 [Claussenomyces sp. TS43310]|nr:MAG: hypothetical protein M1818_001935 [Claussenomyces sp. TS43310]